MTASGLQFTLIIGDIDNLSVLKFTGQEGLSSGYEYSIELASRNPNIVAEQVVDQDITLIIWQDGIEQQRIHGIACEFKRGDTGHHHTHYSLTLVPALHRLSLRHNSRIFQQKSVPDIIATLLSEMDISDYAFTLNRACQIREYCVQYRETDLAFMRRLVAEEGIFYHFEHSPEKHTLMFSNDSQVLTTLATPLLYNAMSSGVQKQPFVRAFTYKTQIKPSSVSLKDHSFKKPQYSFLQKRQGTEQSYQRESYEHFDQPGRYKDDYNGKAFSQVRIDQLRQESNVATGQSNVAQLLAGMKFDLQDHTNHAHNRDWLLVSITHIGTQPQALEESGGEGMTTYNNTFVAIPGHRQWRAETQPKPRVDGPQIASVVGPPNEEIFCDEFGRVKLHFPWDRYSGTDENASCWVRVSQAWAGGQYGMMTIPRIGHEVIVEFLEGDPDQPIITGRTFNAINQAPYKLPEHKTRTVLRTETYQGEGYNELRFEDQVDQEEIYIHAQKDVNIHINNDRKEQVKQDQHLDVDNDRYTRIKNNDNSTVDAESRHYSKGDHTFISDASLHMKQGKNLLLDAGNEVHIKMGQKMVIDAGAAITVKVGGSFVKIDPAGIHLVGAAVKINSGGSAGKGKGYTGTPPVLPGIVEAGLIKTPPKITVTPALIHKLIVDLQQDSAVTEVCQKQTDGSCPLTNCPCGNNK